MNPDTGALYQRTPRDDLADALLQVDDGPAEPDPDPLSLVTVRVASAEHRSGVHVIDPDYPDATLCGHPVVWELQRLPERSVARPCTSCQAVLRDRVDLGDWPGLDDEEDTDADD